MRKLMAALVLVSCAAPAFGAPRDRDADAVAERLSDRATQRAISGAMGAMTAAILDLRIDAFRRAMDPWRDPRDRDYDGNAPETLRDVVARDDPYFEDRVAYDSGRAVATMGAAARGIADVVPAMADAVEDLSRRVEDATRRIPRD